jgi:hypothetical protein
MNDNNGSFQSDDDDDDDDSVLWSTEFNGLWSIDQSTYIGIFCILQITIHINSCKCNKIHNG